MVFIISAGFRERAHFPTLSNENDPKPNKKYEMSLLAKEILWFFFSSRSPSKTNLVKKRLYLLLSNNLFLFFTIASSALGGFESISLTAQLLKLEGQSILSFRKYVIRVAILLITCSSTVEVIHCLHCYTFNPISSFETSPGNFTSIWSESPVFVQALAAYVS